MKIEFENEIVSVTAGESDEKKRLDSFCSEMFSLTRSGAVIQLEEGHITVNGKNESKNYRVKNGDIIDFEPPEPKPAEIVPEDIPLTCRLMYATTVLFLFLTASVRALILL